MDRDQAYLLDILGAAKLAISYVEGITLEKFLTDTQIQDSVIRRLEIIGEAAKRISDETKESYSSVPWIEMISMRNFMIHEYDDVDVSIVWETVNRDLPVVISLIEPFTPFKEQ